MLHFGVITLIPEYFQCLHLGVLGRAIEQNLVKIDIWNPRDWGKGTYKKVDDKPYGGGPGVVMQYEPVSQALTAAKKHMPQNTRTIYLSPQGKMMRQDDFNQLASIQQPLLFLTGRYEGVDERIIEQYIDEEWSIGDFVLSGGELPVLVCIDAISRLIPGSLGHLGSAIQDSFMNGLLDYPHYTRPYCTESGLKVPEVLLKGNHHDIAQWQRKQSLGRTWLKRPDLLKTFKLSDSDQKLLDEFKREHGKNSMKRPYRSNS